MIAELIKTAVTGDPRGARDVARTLADPALLAQFRTVLACKLTATERKLAYEFLDYLARNSDAPEVAAFLIERLGLEEKDAIRLEILGTLRLLEGLDCQAIEPLLGSLNPRLRLAVIQALGSCTGARPAVLLSDILQQSSGGEETRVCAEALARCGDAAAVHVMIDMIDGLERTRQNMDGILSLLVAVSVRCGPDHREWLRDQVPWRTDPVERWLILVGLARQGTTEDCRLVAEQVEAYLRKPTGPIRLMTGPIRLPHQTLFQAGMSFLHRMCPPQFAALAEQARVADLPPEDQQWLTSVLS